MRPTKTQMDQHLYNDKKSEVTNKHTQLSTNTIIWCLMFIKILLESAWLLVLWPSACFIYSNLWRFSSIPSSSIDERVVLARVCVRAKSVGQPFPPLDPTALGDQAAIFDPRSSLEYSDYKRGHVCGGQFKEGYRGKGTKSPTNEGPEIRAAAS